MFAVVFHANNQPMALFDKVNPACEPVQVIYQQYCLGNAEQPLGKRKTMYYCNSIPTCVCCAGDAGSDPFRAENRMGLDGTLHRISAIRGRDQQQSITGLTYRIGWHMSGVLCLLASADVVCNFHHCRPGCLYFPAHNIY